MKSRICEFHEVIITAFTCHMLHKPTHLPYDISIFILAFKHLYAIDKQLLPYHEKYADIITFSYETIKQMPEVS